MLHRRISTSNKIVFYFKLVIFFSALILITTNASAQSRWSFEIRPGINFATKDPGGVKLNTGFGAEGTLNFRLMPHLSAYAGWSWNRFSYDQSPVNSKIDLEETGYNFGLRFMHPIEGSRLSYLIKGGGTYNHIETENSEGNLLHDSGHGLGWQLGFGLAIPVSTKINLVPELRYRSLSRDIMINNVVKPADLNYISAGMGISFNF
jgi:opacity protein-like surface antigen